MGKKISSISGPDQEEKDYKNMSCGIWMEIFHGPVHWEICAQISVKPNFQLHFEMAFPLTKQSFTLVLLKIQKYKHNCLRQKGRPHLKGGVKFMLREDELKLQLLQKILVCWYVPGNGLIFFSSFLREERKNPGLVNLGFSIRMKVLSWLFVKEVNAWLGGLFTPQDSVWTRTNWFRLAMAYIRVEIRAQNHESNQHLGQVRAGAVGEKYPRFQTELDRNRERSIWCGICQSGRMDLIVQ